MRFTNRAVKKLKNTEAIISTDTAFGLRDYFLIRAERYGNRWKIVTEQIDIDRSLELIKSLKIDFSNRQITAYANPGNNFRQWWKSIPNEEKEVY